MIFVVNRLARAVLRHGDHQPGLLVVAKRVGRHSSATRAGLDTDFSSDEVQLGIAA